MGKKDKKVAKYLRDVPSEKKSRVPESFVDSSGDFPVWRYSYVDLDGQFGWRQVSEGVYHDHVIRRLKEYEKVRWGDMEARPHCHPMPIDTCEKEAQNRLKELGIDYDTLFQLALDGEARLFGIRVQQVYYLLWYDPDHLVYKVKTGKYAGK